MITFALFAHNGILEIENAEYETPHSSPAVGFQLII